MRSATIVIAATALTSFASAFVNWGCMAPDFVSSKYIDVSRYPGYGLTALVNMVTSPDHPANSYMGCPTHCRELQMLWFDPEMFGNGWDGAPVIPPRDPLETPEEREARKANKNVRVSAFRQRTGGGLGECYCLDYQALEKTADAMVIGDGPKGDCFPDDFQVMNLDIHRFTTRDVFYYLESCVAENPFDWSVDPGYAPEPSTESSENPPMHPGGVFETTQPEHFVLDCSVNRADHPMYVVPRPGSSDWICYCGQGLGNLIPANCGPGVGRFYRVGRPPVPSSLSLKRSLAAARAEEASEFAAYSHCPRGLDACSISGSKGAYECLDTTSELESCGGCMEGYFDHRYINGTIGTDCTSIDGVTLGGASCVDGRCRVTACRKGYELEGDRCVSSLSLT